LPLGQKLPAARLALALLQLRRRAVPLQGAPRGKKITQNSDQISKRRNQIKSNPNQPGTPRPESNQRDHPDPNPKGEQPLLPSSSWRRARRPPMRGMRRRCSPSLLVVSVGGGLVRCCRDGLVDARALEGSRRSEKTLKSDAASGEREAERWVDR